METIAEKKYYWLKLKRDFFKRHDVRIIEKMPNGKDYILFYLKMLLESIDHEGALRFSETIPYNEEMISVITDTNVDIVKSAMKLFVELGMVEILDDSTIYMNEVQRLIGSETAVAERVRKHREKKLLLQCNTDETKSNTEIDIEKEKEKEVDKEKHATIVAYLNEKAGTRYKPTTGKTQSLIRARLAEGFTLEDFKTVIDKKCADWLNTEYAQYLRPETLFNATKFENYLNAKGGKRKAPTVTVNQDDLDDVF